MKQNLNLIEAGRIVSTHGTKGEVRINPWCDSPEFLCRFDRLFIGNSPVKCHLRPHGTMVIAALEGVENINGAMALKETTVFICRDDIDLEPGRYFVSDLLGLKAYDERTGQELGVITDVLSMPAQDIWEISGRKKYLVPAVAEFVSEVRQDEGYVRLQMIEGLEV